MNKTIFSAASLIAALAVSGTAMAGGYAGMSIGQSTIDDTVNNVSVDESSTAWKVYGGFGITDMFGAELGWADLGDHNESGAVDIETDGFYGAGTINLPLGDSGFSAIGKAGFYMWDQDVNTLSDDGVDAMYGLGVKYIYDDMLGIALEWERYNVDNEVDMISLGLTLNF